MTVSMPEEKYFLGSNSIIGVTVIIPTPDATNIFGLLFTFPYNIGVALSVAITVGFYAARRNARMQEELMMEPPRPRVVQRREYIGFEDGVPLEYTSYEEGVVKLFNRFFVSMQRIYPDFDETLTPREFQYLLMERIPQNADALLEDLVTGYEIAMYSNISVSQDDFNRTNATIELILELMNSG
jgi:hypothetical protein